MFQPNKLALAICGALAFNSGLVQAQAEKSGENLDVLLEEIVVTGTHIKGLDMGGALPVSQLDKEDMAVIGAASTEELLAAIPQVGSVQFNSDNEGTSSNNVRGDVASMNLRGLGADSTLILVNGRRMVLNPSSSTINGVPVQFVNTAMLPAMGIDRVEVLRDGAAAIYGTDAVAGVANYVLDTDYEGFEMRVRQGGAEGESLEETSIQLHGGFEFNDGATNATFYLSDFNRSGITAAEVDWAEHSDYRDTSRTPSAFIGDTSLRNLSTFTPWGQFNLGNFDSATGQFSPVGVSGMARSSDGRFHIQPESFSGGQPIGNGLDIDDSTLDSSLRYNINDLRMLTGDLERQQLFTTLTHELGDGLELFGEASYYQSDYSTYFGPNVISDVNQMYIPKDAYYNPFGPVGSVNRLAGLPDTVPDEGLNVKIDRLRLYDTGPREIEVESESYRFLGGIRGEFNGWDWEAASFYSEAEAEDSQLSVSRSRFYEAVSRTTPDAYNPFTGGNLADVANGDPTSGGDASEFVVHVKRKNETRISGVDFKFSRPDLFSLKSGDVGAAFGVEQRRETYLDDRDDLLDGTVTFTNPLSGQFFDSDIMGVSATPDSEGKREVYSAYGELAVPLIGEHQNIPLVQRLDAQIALRAENYSDVDEDVLKPKVAVSWRPTDWLQVRSAWSKGFRAPNLETLNLSVQERFNNNQEDFLRCATGQAAGTSEADVDACSTSIITRRLGNPDLEPEDSENLTIGVVIEPTMIEGLTLTLDWWQIEQEGVVGLFGRDNHLLLDQVMRFNGSSNPDVVRADVTAQDQAEMDAYNAANGTNLAAVGELLYINDTFTNLQPRTMQGADLGVVYRIPENDLGDFTVKFNAAYLIKWDQEASSEVESLMQALDANPLITGSVTEESVGSQLQDESKPRWRANASLNWRLDQWSAGLSARYVGKVFDPDVRADADPDKFLKIPGWLTFNTYADYSFEGGALDETRVRFGIKNLTDEEPPLFDNSRGYSSELHSNRGRYFYLDVKKKF
ncbi:TonB-dependent receptor [Pseudomaricurvus alkylphenolicus]|uniref:TonB-dependent receptor domain-containing protein n=1 Tax=Pseudomaricurvus alkylphenolicus TaxID=1306991 RepID=UPI00141F3A89|nr:TonB-dependent receptor [Pseudomaricurvus alkylphenolicus]NIB39143.1 TonB-dependent receptor [Pseudomaricurvus alkylphenolicus]